MLTLGIDIGSTASKAVIMRDGKDIITESVVSVGTGTRGPKEVFQNVLNQAYVTVDQIDRILATGYGRMGFEQAAREVSEISCHARGVHYLVPTAGTIIDIGGQDAKAIRVNSNGSLDDFIMNDKCAAGTGRFLEMMARTLEVDIAELGPLSLKSTENIEISSMCSVFAESEVISLIAQNKETSDIAHGIHMAIAAKAISLMRRVGLEPGYMMTGGVAQNPGVVKVLEEQLKAPLFISEEPEIVGALGAALYGLEGIF